eukprot:5772017-Amphidinium_carterae.1
MSPKEPNPCGNDFDCSTNYQMALSLLMCPVQMDLFGRRIALGCLKVYDTIPQQFQSRKVDEQLNTPCTIATHKVQERVAHALSDCFKEHEEAWLRMQDASVRQMHEELLDLRRQLKQHQRNQQQTPEGDQCDHPLAELGVSDSEVPVVAEPEPPTFQVVQYEPVVANAV